jgi:superfamily II DNA/RNA helicase
MTRLSLMAMAILLAGVAVAMIGVADCDCASPLGITGVAAFAAPRQQRRNPQQSSSQSSSSSPPGGKKKKPSTKTMGGNQNWYNKRKAGVKVKSNGPKPPKWEKEGDDLYVNHNSARNVDEDDEASKEIIVNHKNTTYDEARTLLRPFEDEAGAASTTSVVPTTQQLSPKAASSDVSNHNSNGDDNGDEDDNPAEAEKPFLWGELSIGPVWKSRLVRAGYAKPTPIQVASYTALTNKKNRTSTNGNAVIAASTGSGKSLAYLLPFLTSIDTDNRKQKMKRKTQNHQRAAAALEPSFASVTPSLGRIWIMTPTMELAYQLQRTVDRVIVGDENLDEGEISSNVFHVVEYNKGAVQPKGIGEQFSFSTSFPILSDIVHRYYNTDATISQEPTFLAGTPKLFLQLRKEIKKVLASTTKVDSNLRYAKQRQARKLREASEEIQNINENDDGDGDGDGDGDDNNEKETVEEQLLYRKVALALEGNLETLILDEVDRLLQTTTAMARREHKTTKPLAQELLDTLVWESKKRPSSSRALEASGKKKGRHLLFANPSSDSSKLQIVCASATIGRSLRRQLMYTIRAPSMDKAALLVTADVRTKKNAELRKASLLPSNLKHSFQIVPSDSEKKDAATKTLQALVTTLTIQEHQAPSLVFPGTVGVETVRDHLLNSGFRDVRGLSSLRSGKDDDSMLESSSPMDTPVYVVKERLARGLDLPHVKRVVLLGVPSNAASYAHLAGRTARQNTHGDCTVLCKPSEAHKLVSIAETLGLHEWRCLDDDDDVVVSPATGAETMEVASGARASTSEGEDGGDEGDLAGMNKTALKSKKVPELREFLESKGISTKGLLRNSLVDAVLQLKERG